MLKVDGRLVEVNGPWILTGKFEQLKLDSRLSKWTIQSWTNQNWTVESPKTGRYTIDMTVHFNKNDSSVRPKTV